MSAAEQPEWADPVDLRPIAMVATDLDGTLLGADGRVSKRSRAAAHAAMAAGIELVLITGRPTRWIHHVIDDIGLHLTCVCSNGAIVLETAVPELTFVGGVSNDVILNVAAALREVVPEVGFALEFAPKRGNIYTHDQTFAHDADYRPRWEPPSPVPIAPLDELLNDQPVVKLLARTELHLNQNEIDTVITAARVAVGHQVEVTHAEPGSTLLEISARGIDKGSGLARVAAAKGVGREHIAAVGDMLNDLPMLEWVQHPFAVSNAHPVLRQVGRVLPTNDDDAVAQLLEAVVAAQRS